MWVLLIGGEEEKVVLMFFCVLVVPLFRPAGYVDAIPLNSTTIGLIFENGNHTFADRVSFQAVELP